LLISGKCGHCGTKLNHANTQIDHIVPFALGGQTNLSNAQALCVRCNQMKGINMTIDPHHPLQVADRKWQVECLAEIATVQAEGGTDFLASVTPAGGKTYFGAEVARRALVDSRADVVVVLAPSENICKGWMTAGKKFGINLLRTVDRSVVDRGVAYFNAHGIVVTYQWLSNPSNVTLLTRLVVENRAIVIADEIHHTAEGKPWGAALYGAAEKAAFRLGLSGTPFRTDDLTIPFLHYGDDGRSVPHYEYLYGQALTDGVVAPAHFRWVNGTVSVQDEDGDAEQWSFDQSATMTEERRGALLTQATKGSSNFLRDVIAAAHGELINQRRADPKDGPRAGGLVIAQNKEAAQAVFDYITKILKSSAVLVHSGLAAADQDIESYKESETEWLVSVAMVSEGVDIPRLRVLAYVTNERTQLAFIQGAGRVTRTIKGRAIIDQPVFVYLPKLSDFENYARDIEQAVIHQIGVPTIDDVEPGEPGTDDAHGAVGGNGTRVVVCPNCGHHNTPGVGHCVECGDEMPARGVRNGRVVLDADGFEDGVTLNGQHHDEALLDDAVVVFRITADDHREYDRLGHVAWCAGKLTELIRGQQSVFGMPPEHTVEAIRAAAARKRGVSDAA
jgi:superfamily II DNA or RNA helicase